MAIGDVILDGSGPSAGAGSSAGAGALDRSRAVAGGGAGGSGTAAADELVIGQVMTGTGPGAAAGTGDVARDRAIGGAGPAGSAGSGAALVAPPGSVVWSGTADCLLRCCLPYHCRCGSNFTNAGDTVLCALPPPPAEYGRAMPATLYGQVTGYRTLKVIQQCFSPFGKLQAGGCFEYLSQLVNWPFTYVPAYGGYVGANAWFKKLQQGAAIAPDCTFVGYTAWDDPTPPVVDAGTGTTADLGIYLRLNCRGELRCTFAAVHTLAAESCGSDVSAVTAPNCVKGAGFLVKNPSRLTFDESVSGAARGNWYRSGVLSCDPFWGRVEFFDALDDSGHLAGGEPTCDQSGHPDPPCCPHPVSGLKGPCGLLSDPPEVLAYQEVSPFGTPCNDETDNPGNREPAALAVRIDFTEDPL